MTDRELLELAAKAAGIEGKYMEGFGYGGIYQPVIGGCDVPWNPLCHDGQALRLAVKLTMETYHADDGGWSAYAAWPNARGFAYAVEAHGSDACSATRRAIVRAAAEIGKAMP